MEISYWSDIACPFCYIGASRMKRAMAAVGLNPEDLTMKAYQLNPNAPLETSETLLTEFAAGHGMTTEQAKAQFAHMESMGNEKGLHIDMAGIIPTNTFSAHRLIKWSQKYLDKKDHQNFIMALYYLYFEEHANIADHSVLLAVISEFALLQEEAAQVLAGDAFADDVKHDILEAHQSGVQGAPFFVLNNKYGISGAQPYESMLAVLKQIQAEEGAQ